MPLEAPLAPVAERVADLNARYRHHAATEVLEHALTDPQVGRIAMVSSFGAESVALLHMVSVIDQGVPVIFLDTEMIFPETRDYQAGVAERLGLRNLHISRPDPTELFLRDPENDLHISDPDACCTLRKIEPLEDALDGFDAWITGRKRFHGGKRVALDFFEAAGSWTRDATEPK